MARYGKEYGSEAEVMVRLGNFVASLEEAASLQAQANLDNASVVYGATKFSDLSREEFVAFAAPGKGAHGKPGGGTPDYQNTCVHTTVPCRTAEPCAHCAAGTLHPCAPVAVGAPVAARVSP